MYEFYHWDNVVKVLHNCPKLQVITIEQVTCVCGIFFLAYFLCLCFVNLILAYVLQWINKPGHQDLNKNWNYPNDVPKCISSHLRSCTLIFQGIVDELRFATYILQNAPHLEVIEIFIVDYNFRKPKMYLRMPIQDALEEELNSCPMISPKCKRSITFR